MCFARRILLACRESVGRVTSLPDFQPLHAASWIELEAPEVSALGIKQQLTALRRLFDWLVTGQEVPVISVGATSRSVLRQDPGAGAVRGAGPSRLHRRFHPSRFAGSGAIAIARIGAALGMKVEDLFTQNRRLWVRLHGKRGKDHAVPCHHNLEQILTAYLGGDLRRRFLRGRHSRPFDGFPLLTAYFAVHSQTHRACSALIMMGLPPFHLPHIEPPRSECKEKT